MYTTFLLGNGFDLAYGMHTSYADFYKDYALQPSSTATIKALKKEITLWSDLEAGLGDYSSEVESAEAFFALLMDINEALTKYMRKQDAAFQPTDAMRNNFLKSLLAVAAHMTAGDKQSLAHFVSNISSGDNIINAVTFNYTQTFEKLLGTNDASLKLGTFYGHPCKFNQLHHIHGSLTDSCILLGVNEVEQIKNNSFRENTRIQDYFVKPITNDSIDGLRTEQCEETIQNANVLVTFGLSFGQTDALWWAAIAKRLANDPVRLVIFEYTTAQLIPQLLRTDKNEVKERFLQAANVREDIRPLLMDKIFVVLQNPLFGVPF